MIGDLVEPRSEPVGVLRAHRGQGTKHDEIERALKEFYTFARCTGHRSEADVLMASLSCQVERTVERTIVRFQRWAWIG